MNILMIVTDTFRRDNISCYAQRPPRTPQLDRFAQSCVIFDRAYANSYPTMPARADFMTGRYTFTYRGWEPLGRHENTMASAFRAADFTTMGVVDTPFFVKEAYNYDQGFADFMFMRGAHPQEADGLDVAMTRTYETDHPSPSTMFAAERWLQRHYKEKFFLYVDTWDPHEPWDAPLWYTQQYDPDWTGDVPVPAYGYYKDRGITDKDIQRGYAAYCGEVTMVDRWVGRLLDTVEQLGLLKNTAIVFTSDHGYYFGEHGIYGKTVMSNPPFDKLTLRPNQHHAQKNFFRRSPVYQEVANIPLLIYVPGIDPGRRAALVSHADLMPTLLELGAADIPATVHGSSLVPAIRDRNAPIHDFVVTSWPLYNVGETSRAVDSYERVVSEHLPATITTGEWQMLYTCAGEPAELYNLDLDPRQERNVIAENMPRARDMHAQYVSLLKSANTEDRLLRPRLAL